MKFVRHVEIGIPQPDLAVCSSSGRPREPLFVEVVRVVNALTDKASGDRAIAGNTMKQTVASVVRVAYKRRLFAAYAIAHKKSWYESQCYLSCLHTNRNQ